MSRKSKRRKQEKEALAGKKPALEETPSAVPENTPSGPFDWKEAAPWFLGLSALVFVVYARIYQHSFIYGDDELLIVRNVFLRDWKHLPELLLSQTREGSGVVSNLYRPTQMFLYFLAVQVSGIQPWAIQTLNILAHAGAACALFVLLRRWVRIDPWTAVLLAAVWALHPIQVEAVANINGSADPFHLFPMLVALLLFASGRTIAAGVAFLVGLGAKEAAIVLPALAYARDALVEDRWKPEMKRYAGILIAAAVYLAIRQGAVDFGKSVNFYEESNVFTENFIYRVFTLFAAWGKGLSLLAWPTGLHPESSMPVFADPFTPRVFVPMLAIGLWIAAAWRRRRAAPFAAFGTAWFFIAYAPMSNLVAKINALFWEHWFYGPSVGLVLIAASGARRLPEARLKLLRPAAGALVAVFSIASFRQAAVWRDSESLFAHILKYESQSAKTWNNYAMALGDRDKREAAARAYQKAISISDTYSQTRHNLANFYRDKGREALKAKDYETASAHYRTAEKHYRRAIQIDPNFYFSRVAYGEILLQAGKTEQAVRQFETALRAYPHLPRVRALLAKIKARGVEKKPSSR